MVKQIKQDSDFAKELSAAGDKLVVVDFFATWCGPCMRIAPQVDELSKKYSEAVFIKVDCDECEDTASEQGISAMPTFNFYHKGKKIDSMMGADAGGLEEKIKANIAKVKG